MEANKQYHAILWKDDQPLEVHHFTLTPDANDNRYTAINSMNWFNEREAKALVAGAKKDQLRSSIKNEQDWALDREFERRAYAPHPALTDTLPEFTHTSIWDFYKAINYDYKKQKYVVPTGVPEFTQNTIYVVEHAGTTPVAVHFFELPPFGQANGVNQTYRSYNALRQRWRSDFSKVYDKALLTKTRIPSTFRHMRTQWAEVDAMFAFELEVSFANVPKFVHEDYPAFLKHVRYDIKRKRFLKDGEDFKDGTNSSVLHPSENQHETSTSSKTPSQPCIGVSSNPSGKRTSRTAPQVEGE